MVRVLSFSYESIRHSCKEKYGNSLVLFQILQKTIMERDLIFIQFTTIDLIVVVPNFLNY